MIQGKRDPLFTNRVAWADIRISHAQSVEIDSATACVIARWWQSPGTVGSTLAALASGCEVNLTDLLDDIHRTRLNEVRLSTPNSMALDMLATWAINYARFSATERSN